MKWVESGMVTAVATAIVLFEQSGIRHRPRKEKAAFAALMAIGYLLAILLVHYPDIPGPDKWVEVVYKPLFGNILE